MCLLSSPCGFKIFFPASFSSCVSHQRSEWINEAEVKLVQNLVQIIHREGYKAMSIAILSPYKEQARQLREQIPYFPG